MNIVRLIPFTIYPLLLLILLCTRIPVNAQSSKRTQDSLIQLLSRQKEDTRRVELLNELSLTFYQTSLDSVFAYASRAQALGIKLNDRKGIATSYYNMTVYYIGKGDYQQALVHDLLAIKIHDSLQETKLLATDYLIMSQIYKDLSGQGQTGEYIQKGIDYSRIAHNIFHHLADTAGMVESLNQIGIVFRDWGMLPSRLHYYDSALTQYTRAMDLIKISGKGMGYKGRLLNNTSQVYIEYRKNYPLALDYLFKAVAYNEERVNYTSLSYNYGNISNVYLLMRDRSKALMYAGLMLAAARHVQRPSRIYDAYRQYYDVFNGFHQPDSALHYFVLASNLNDSLTNVAKTSQILDLQTKYETEKKEVEILKLDKANSDKSRQIFNLSIFLSLVGALASGFILLFVRVRRQKKQLNLQSQKLSLMMSELHHRVKNNLQIVSSLLSLQAYKLDDEQSIGVLRESQQRIQAMSLIHQRLYKKEALTNVNIKEYLVDLMESLMSSYGYRPDEFDLRLEVMSEWMDIDLALPIGLIVNELVTNAFKYAYTGITHPSLLIRLEENGQSLSLCVQDNGVGMNGVNKEGRPSFGRQLIGALCRQLRAEQKVEIDKGTSVTLLIPKKAA